MKTNTKNQQTIRMGLHKHHVWLLMLMLIPASFLVTGCGTDAAPPSDPRTAFVGSFEAENFEVRIQDSSSTSDTDTTVTVATNPALAFKILGRLNEDELSADFTELMEALWERMYVASGLPVNVEVEKGEGAIAVISGNEFVIEQFTKKASIDSDLLTDVLEFDFSADGDLADGKLTLNFELNYSSTNITMKFTGSIVGFNPQPEPPALAIHPDPRSDGLSTEVLTRVDRLQSSAEASEQ